MVGSRSGTSCAAAMRCRAEAAFGDRPRSPSSRSGLYHTRRRDRVQLRDFIPRCLLAQAKRAVQQLATGDRMWLLVDNLMGLYSGWTRVRPVSAVIEGNLALRPSS